jgi:hypothetical protein
MLVSDIERIDIAEFRREGYLAELNRRFLHPLGLALEVVAEAKCASCGCEREDHWTDPGNPCPKCASTDDPLTSERLGGVWDYRDDPEGIYFGNDLAELGEIADHIAELWAKREGPRVAALGYMIQPPGG